MEENKFIEELFSEYLKGIRESGTVYPFLFEMAWTLFRKKGDKKKAFGIWEQIPANRVKELLEHLLTTCPYDVRKEDLRDFENYLLDYVTSYQWEIELDHPLTIGELIKMLSNYNDETKIVLSRYGIPANEESLSYCYCLTIENKEGKDYSGEKQIKGIELILEDDLL